VLQIAGLKLLWRRLVDDHSGQAVDCDEAGFQDTLDPGGAILAHTMGEVHASAFRARLFVQAHARVSLGTSLKTILLLQLDDMTLRQGWGRA
jgi:hypothetical protein